MSTHALYLVRMDVAHDHEAVFTGICDLGPKFLVPSRF
jgi:hypothetical protein